MVFCNNYYGKSELYKEDSHNPYFNRWFSAIIKEIANEVDFNGHNPYFNRWFSAIKKSIQKSSHTKRVTILILIDGFLQ